MNPTVQPTQLAQTQDFAAGTMIFTEGAAGQTAYVLVEGEVDIVKGAGDRIIVLKTLRPGEMFGEMALLTDNQRAASAIARTDAKLEVIDRMAFARLLQTDPEFAVATLKRIAGMIPESQARIISQFKEQAGAGEAAPAKADAFAPDYVRLETEPVPQLVKVGAVVIAAFLVAVVTWASLAQMEVRVTGIGRIVSDEPNLKVAPLANGVLRQVMVREGASVAAGQRLAVLDATDTAADIATLESQLVGAHAQAARLRAELGRGKTDRFSASAAEEALQRRLYDARMEQYRAARASRDEDLRSLGEQVQQKRSEAASLERQLQTLREIERVRRDYAAREKDAFLREGQYRLQYLDAQRAVLVAERDLTLVQGTLQNLEAQVRNSRAQREAFVGDWQARANQELISAERDALRASEQLKKARLANRLTELRAPQDAVVLSVAALAPGTVLRAGDPVFELVPAGVKLEVELDVSPRDIASLHAGQKTYIKIDSLPYIRHGMMEGEVRLVSGDILDKNLAGQAAPSFRARVSLGEMKLRNLPQGFRLRPGMTVSADVRVDTRPVITYFLYPILRAVNSSMREP